MSRSSRSGVLGTDEADTWNTLLARIPRADVYFSPDYLLALEKWGEGEARAFFYEEGDDLLLYPFMRRELPRFDGLEAEIAGYGDVSTPYGYGGPILSGEPSPGFAARARAALENHFRDDGVISEFIRFHPLIDNQAVWPLSQIRMLQNTVAMDLAGGETPILQRMNPNTRRKVRRSFRENLDVEISRSVDAVGEFWRVYDATMTRLGAKDYYHFSQDALLQFVECLGDRAWICLVRSEGATAAAGLFLHYGEFLHYHLGGSSAELLNVRPNDRMFYEMAAWGHERGAKMLHLGGGAAGNDSLFRFKSGFSDLVFEWYLGSAIHDANAYSTLTAAREKSTGKPAPAEFFPAYRG